LPYYTWLGYQPPTVGSGETCIRARGTIRKGQLPDTDEKAMEDRVALSPQRRTGRTATPLPCNEGNHAGELPEDMSLASMYEEAVEWFSKAIKYGGGRVFEIGSGKDVKSLEAQARVNSGEPPQKGERNASIPLIAVGTV
jgi:hypothetical protein